MSSPARDLYLGIDLGGSKILAGVVDGSGRIRSRAKRPTPYRAAETPLKRELSLAIHEALAAAKAGPQRLAAVGMGSPGPLDPDRGVVLRTPNLSVKNFAAGAFLSKELGAPFVLDNDVHMAVFGEHEAGAARGHDRVVGIWVGTGVGGCVIWDGKIVHGVNRNAGELGHMILDTRKAKAGSKKGTLEWEASKTGLVRRLRKQIRKGKKTMLAKHLKGNQPRLKSNELGDAFRDGDRLAVEAVRNSAWYVGVAIANLFDALAPDLFLLGGGVVAELGNAYLALVRESAEAHAFTTELGKVRIGASRLGDDAGMLGAALAARAKHPLEPAKA